MSAWRDSNKGKSYEDVISELNDRIVALEQIISVISPDSSKYPALAEAYKEYKLVERLTLGNDKT